MELVLFKRVKRMGNNKQSIWREAMNANLFLYFLLLGTSPLTVIPSTGHEIELIEKGQRKIGKVKRKWICSVCSAMMSSVKKCALGITFRVAKVCRVKLNWQLFEILSVLIKKIYLKEIDPLHPNISIHILHTVLSILT